MLGIFAALAPVYKARGSMAYPARHANSAQNRLRFRFIGIVPLDRLAKNRRTYFRTLRVHTQYELLSSIVTAPAMKAACNSRVEVSK
jgi:hypothetical protein